MLQRAIPVLHVAASRAAETFYCRDLGFSVAWASRFGAAEDPCYMSVTRDGATVHLSSFPDDGVAGGVLFVALDDVDALHAELVARGVRIRLEPTDQTWGNREMYVADPDGNVVRFVQGGAR